MIKRLTIFGCLLGLAIAAAGCSNSASQLLTTGSLFGTKSKPKSSAPAAIVVKPTDRAIQVAATSARAQKCGYFFDPAKLRTAYLASELQTGLPPADVAQLTKVYDYTTGKLTKVLAGKEGYCNGQRVTKIKSSLTRHLAGDFTPPKSKKKRVAAGWFDFATEEPLGKEKLNPDWVNNPSQESVTKRVEPE